MHLLKGLAISISLYSKIPMPQFEWKEEDMKYSLLFFPLVGLVIGALEVLWFFVTEICLSAGGNAHHFPTMAAVLFAVAIPLLVTGGFHVDGYMDVQDALHSYGDREKKLAILKDPHIGAFAVIRVITLGLIYTAALSLVWSNANLKTIVIFGLTFVMARCMSGMAALKLPKAKKEGMLVREAGMEERSRKCIMALLLAQEMIAWMVSLSLDFRMGILLLWTQIFVFLYYRRKCEKEFGGVTGDTAGYFLVLNETAMTVLLAVAILVS